MRPLSAFAFIKGSISKILPLVITVCLASALLYFLSLFLLKMDEQGKEANAYPMEHMSVIYAGKYGIKAEDLEKLKKQSGDVAIYPADIYDVVYKTILGGTGSSLYLLEGNDIAPLMKNENLSLYKGRLPLSASEVILNKKLAANYGLKVGSIIQKDTKDWNIGRGLKVVGLFRGKAVMGIGTEDKKLLKLGLPYISIVAAGQNMEHINQYIEKHLSSDYAVSTLKTDEEFLGNFNGPIAAMKLFIGIVLLLVIGVFLANITSIQYSTRKKELELLYAVGYTRKYIIVKALKEISTAAFIGYILGILSGTFMTWTLNMCFLSEKGLDMPLISPRSMLNMLVVPAAITVFSMIAPLKASRFRDLI